MKPLQIEGARALADAEAINHVRVVASTEGLSVEVNQTFIVANRLKQTRYFAKADTCFSWLREMGISRIHEVDLTHWGQGTGQETHASRVLAFVRFNVAELLGAEWTRLTEKVQALSKKGNHAGALLVAEQALQTAEESLEPDHPDIAVLLNSLANEHYALEQFEQAEPLYKRALENAEKTHGPHNLFVATCLNNLAEAYDAQGKSEHTEAMYFRALGILEKEFGHELGADQTPLAIVLNNLASLYVRQGNYTKAGTLFKRALKTWNDVNGIVGMLVNKNPNVAISLEGLAEVYRKTGQGEKAAPLEKRALAIRAGRQ